MLIDNPGDRKASIAAFAHRLTTRAGGATVDDAVRRAGVRRTISRRWTLLPRFGAARRTPSKLYKAAIRVQYSRFGRPQGR